MNTETRRHLDKYAAKCSRQGTCLPSRFEPHAHIFNEMREVDRIQAVRFMLLSTTAPQDMLNELFVRGILRKTCRDTLGVRLTPFVVRDFAHSALKQLFS